MEEEKKLSYKGYGDVVFENKDDIAYYKTSQNLEIAQASLLGFYDEKGNYKINDDINKELVGLDKVIDEDIKGVYYLSAKVAEHKLKFTVEMESINHKKSAFLYLKETCSVGGELEKKFSSLVATYTDTDDINFVFRMKKAFNIFARIEAEGRDMSNSAKSLKILAQKKAVKELKAKLLLDRQKIDKEYVLKMLDLLAKSGPEGKRLVKEFLNAVRVKNLIVQSPDKFIRLRQVLDLYVNNALVEGKISKNTLEKIRVYRKLQTIKLEEIQKQNAGEKSKSGGKSSEGAKKSSKSSKKAGGKSTKKNDKKVIQDTITIKPQEEKPIAQKKVQRKIVFSSTSGMVNQSLYSNSSEQDQNLSKG